MPHTEAFFLGGNVVHLSQYNVINLFIHLYCYLVNLLVLLLLSSFIVFITVLILSPFLLNKITMEYSNDNLSKSFYQACSRSRWVTFVNFSTYLVLRKNKNAKSNAVMHFKILCCFATRHWIQHSLFFERQDRSRNLKWLLQ